MNRFSLRAALQPRAIACMAIKGAIVGLVSLPLVVIAVRLGPFVEMSAGTAAALFAGVLFVKLAFLFLLGRFLKRVIE